MGDATTYEKLFYRGVEANIPEANDGAILFTTDSEKLFIDYGESHIEITDFVKGYDTSTILDITSPLDKIYLASDSNHLYYHDGTNWIDVISNHTHTASAITDLGDLATVDVVNISNVDSTEGLDFGDEDEESEET